MVSLQALGSPHSIFFKPAEFSFTSHFPAAMLHRLTLYTNYRLQVPELNSGSLGNPKTLCHPVHFLVRVSSSDASDSKTISLF